MCVCLQTKHGHTGACKEREREREREREVVLRACGVLKGMQRTWTQEASVELAGRFSQLELEQIEKLVLFLCFPARPCPKSGPVIRKALRLNPLQNQYTPRKEPRHGHEWRYQTWMPAGSTRDADGIGVPCTTHREQRYTRHRGVNRLVLPLHIDPVIMLQQPRNSQQTLILSVQISQALTALTLYPKPVDAGVAAEAASGLVKHDVKRNPKPSKPLRILSR